MSTPCFLSRGGPPRDSTDGRCTCLAGRWSAALLQQAVSRIVAFKGAAVTLQAGLPSEKSPASAAQRSARALQTASPAGPPPVSAVAQPPPGGAGPSPAGKAKVSVGGGAAAGGRVAAAATADKHGAGPPQRHQQQRSEDLQTGSNATGRMDQAPARPVFVAEVLAGQPALQQQQPEAESQHVDAAESHQEQQPRPAPRKPQAADVLSPRTVRALSLGLRRHGGPSTSQQGSQGQPATGCSAAGTTGGSSAAGSRAAPLPAAVGEVNSPPGVSPACTTGLVGPTASGPGGESSQQGLGAPAKPGADPGAEPGGSDPADGTPRKRGWSSEFLWQAAYAPDVRGGAQQDVATLKKGMQVHGHQWAKHQVGWLLGKVHGPSAGRGCCWARCWASPW